MKNTFIFHGKEIKKVGFVGFGKSNKGAFEYLSEKYPALSFCIRSKERLDGLPKKITECFFGECELSKIFEDMLFLSPTVHRDRQELAEAKKRGVILTSDAEFFFENTAAEIYAVTGSSGKSTTSYLTAQLLGCGEPLGNFGNALTPRIEHLRTAVCELSSFQLMHLKPKSERCIITNISENHLDWHKDFSEYIRAKQNILEASNQIICNFDDLITRRLIKDYPPYGVFSLVKREEELRRLVKCECYLTVDGDSIILSGMQLLSLKGIKISGRHNLYNLMASLLLANGRYEAARLHELAASFSGLSHRCETVGIFCGVRYINSSIDSTPMRTAATIDSLSGSIILLLGGRSKGLDFSTVIPHFCDKVKTVIASGECRFEIENALKNSVADFHMTEAFSDAVKLAVKLAKANDTVLLSPAATSYDEFKNFEERGNAFCNIIKEQKYGI